MPENLPVHVSDDKEEIIDNESDVSNSSNSEEEIELDFDSDKEDDKFQASLIVPQQPLILSQQ